MYWLCPIFLLYLLSFNYFSNTFHLNSEYNNKEIEMEVTKGIETRSAAHRQRQGMITYNSNSMRYPFQIWVTVLFGTSIPIFFNILLNVFTLVLLVLYV